MSGGGGGMGVTNSDEGGSKNPSFGRTSFVNGPLQKFIKRCLDYIIFQRRKEIELDQYSKLL